MMIIVLGVVLSAPRILQADSLARLFGKSPPPNIEAFSSRTLAIGPCPTFGGFAVAEMFTENEINKHFADKLLPVSYYFPRYGGKHLACDATILWYADMLLSCWQFCASYFQNTFVRCRWSVHCVTPPQLVQQFFPANMYTMNFLPCFLPCS